MADSSTGGYLVSTETALNVEHFFHDLIMNLTGLTKLLVRPRWQPNSPIMPSSNTDWCAFGVSELESDDTSYTIKTLTGANLVRHEKYSLLCSFYGSNARDNVRKMRDSLEIGQNREILFNNKFGYITCSPVTHIPELINDIWNDRYDIEFQFAREVIKAYNILDIISVQGTIKTESITVPFNIQEVL